MIEAPGDPKGSLKRQPISSALIVLYHLDCRPCQVRAIGIERDDGRCDNDRTGPTDIGQTRSAYSCDRRWIVRGHHRDIAHDRGACGFGEAEVISRNHRKGALSTAAGGARCTEADRSQRRPVITDITISRQRQRPRRGIERTSDPVLIGERQQVMPAGIVLVSTRDLNRHFGQVVAVGIGHQQVGRNGERRERRIDCFIVQRGRFQVRNNGASLVAETAMLRVTELLSNVVPLPANGSLVTVNVATRAETFGASLTFQ